MTMRPVTFALLTIGATLATLALLYVAAGFDAFPGYPIG